MENMPLNETITGNAQNALFQFLSMPLYDWSAELFSENGKYGIKSATGKLLVPAAYDEFICPMQYVEVLNIVVAGKSGKYGMVMADGSGMEITEFIYDFMAPWFGPVTAAIIDTKWNYVTHEGKMLIPSDLDKILITLPDITFENGISVFRKDGLMGVTDGLNYSMPVFDDIDTLEMGELVTGTRHGIKGYINNEGEFTPEEEEAWWSAAD